MASPDLKTKALVVATRCTTVDQFVATFHRFCDDSSFFVSTLAERPIGLETAFSIQLEDKTPVLRGLCEVVEAWSTPLNRFGRPGVRLSVKRLTSESLAVFKMLQVARAAAESAPASELPAVAVARTATAERASPRTTPPSPAVARTSTGSKASTPSSPIPAVGRTATGSKASTPSSPIPAVGHTATGSKASTPSSPIPAVGRTATGSSASPPLGAPIARLPFGRIPTATPPLLPRVDPRVSEAPSLPRYDERSGPVAALPMVAPPTVAPAPAPVAPRQPPKPTPSIIVEDDFAPQPLAAPLPTPAPRMAPTPVLDVPEPIAVSDDMTNPVAVESRTPGSSYVLPANPLMNLTDQSLGGFVDCALYEETGNFFRAPGYEESLVDIDDVVAPPGDGLSPVQAIRTGPTTPPPMQLSPFAFSPAPEQQFAPEATPLPMLAPQRATPPRPYSEPLFPNGVPPHMEQAPHHEAPPMLAPSAALDRPPPSVPMQRVAPIDSTAALLAMSSPNRRRWIMISGVAAATSLLVLAIVVAKSGGGGPKPSPVKVASMDPPESAKTKAEARAKPAVATSDATNRPEVAPPAVSAGKVAPPAAPAGQVAVAPVAPVAADPPDETTDSGAPPVVGSGPCRVTVSSNPAGSMVKIDDQTIGPSPVTFDGPCKRSKIDVKHPRYALGTKWVVLAADKPTEIQVPLARPTFSITIVTTPPGATISIAGNRAGTTPSMVKVMGFTSVKVTVEKKGFKPIVQKVYSKADGERVVLKLERGK